MKTKSFIDKIYEEKLKEEQRLMQALLAKHPGKTLEEIKASLFLLGGVTIHIHN